MAKSVYLTKSDFKKARECPTKLFYKKKGYPSRQDDDPYLAFLADGGFMVETMSRALFPEGDTIGDWSNPQKAHKASEKAIHSGDGTWFEPTVVHGPYLIRIDILRRKGKVLELIEVKSSSIDPIDDSVSPFRGKKGKISSKWRPYLEDVTFQMLVLESAFPEFEVRPILCVVDKSKDAGTSSTYDRFQMVPPAKGQPQWRAEFEYVGDESDLENSHLLAFVDVSKEAAEIRDEVDAARQDFAKSIQNGRVKKMESPPRYKCRNCEYRLKDKKARKSGFNECWGPLANQEPHILDLFRVDLLGGKKRDIPREMAAAGDVRFSAIPANAFGEGVTADRQRTQISGREWSAPILKESLLANPYPLHFIDFEGSRIALPYHENMRPYEQVGFQWSCHTIREPGGEIEHAEWLDDNNAFPNFEFARSLKDHLGTDGTVYIWSPYEHTMLRDIHSQMIKYGHSDPDLARWLELFEEGRDSWVIDLCSMARKYYFHPDMKGSVSIKAVFPAVWRSNRDVRKLSCFKHVGRNSDDPYKSLPALPIGDGEEVVNEGTGAIRVYQDMMFGLAGRDPEKRAVYRKLLLQYCHLDTAAMVAIWWHWTQPHQKPTPVKKFFRFPWW